MRYRVLVILGSIAAILLGVTIIGLVVPATEVALRTILAFGWGFFLGYVWIVPAWMWAEEIDHERRRVQAATRWR